MVLNRKQIAVVVAAFLAVLAQVAFWVPVTHPGEPEGFRLNFPNNGASTKGTEEPLARVPARPPWIEYRTFGDLGSTSIGENPPPVDLGRLLAHFAAIAAVAALLIVLLRSGPDQPRGVVGADGP